MSRRTSRIVRSFACVTTHAFDCVLLPFSLIVEVVPVGVILNGPSQSSLVKSVTSYLTDSSISSLNLASTD